MSVSGVARLAFSPRLLVRTAALCCLSVALSGCGGGAIDAVTSVIGGGGGQRAEPATVTTIGGVSVDQLRADQLCPEVSIREGTQSLQLYVPGEEPTPQALRYQAQITQTAVECTSIGPALALSVGIAGRVLMGPQGAPASIDLPLRVVVLDRFENTVLSSDVIRPRAVIEPTEVSANFTTIYRDLSVPLPQRRTNFVVIVGFDSQET
ncbi:MAG: hypothetical protein AAF739_00890 [Pseudomonadota bacterium]